jgi:thymidylate kinase
VALFTIALIGADGAGKTTIARALETSLPLPVKYLYMGVSPLASNYALPTTRLISRTKRAFGRDADMAGPPDPTRRRANQGSLPKRLLSTTKSLLHLANRLGEEAYRQGVAWSFRRRGYLVVYDRDFFVDYFAHDVANPDPNRSLASRLHGFILTHFYRRPDLVILLDAPAALLYARKGEGSIELLERRRQEYLQLRGHVRQFAIVDATQSPTDVLSDVTALILQVAAGEAPEVSSYQPLVTDPLPEAESSR